MAIKEYNVDLDVKGRILATDVPNSTGSIVTWNAATNVFGLRTNSQIISDLGLNTVVANSHTHTNKTVLDGITSADVNNWNTAYGWGNFRGYGLGNTQAKTINDLGGENNDWNTLPHTLNAFVFGNNTSLNYPGSATEYPIGLKIGYNENIGATILVGRGSIPELRFRPDNSTNSFPWARVWHDVNLPNPATETWVNQNVVPYTGANKPINFNTQDFTTGGYTNRLHSYFERINLASDLTTQSAGNFKLLTNVAAVERANASSQSSDIVITLPITTTTAWQAEIDILREGYRTTLNIGGYGTNNTSRFVNVVYGNINDILEVKFGRIENSTVLIIKRSNSTIHRLQVNISKFYYHHSNSTNLYNDKTKYKVEYINESELTDFTLNGVIANSEFIRDRYLWNKGNFSQTDIDNWNAAYGWGNHAGLYQPLDADLTSIAGLSGTTGLLRKTAANTWSLDTNTYLTANQPITLSGDVTGSGSTSITTSIAANAVTFAKIQNIATGKILGRKTAGSGNIEELTPSDARDILDVPSMSYEKQGRVYYIVGDSGGTAGSWTGTSSEITEYFEGMVIAYQVKTAGASGGTTLNINGLGAIPVRYNNSNVTTQFPIDTIITLVYDGNYFRTHNYVDGSESYVVRYNQSLQVQAPASSYPLLGLGISTGKYHAIYKTNTINDVNDVELDVTGPLLLDNSSSAITVNTARTSSIYAGRGISYTSIIKGATGGTMHEPLFLVGTIGPNGGFIPHHSSGRLSYQIGKPTANADNNGKLYWYVGYFYSSTSIRLEISHPCYLLTDDGEWVPYKQPQSLQDVVNINPAVVIPSGDKTISISSDETEVDYDLLNLTGYSNNNAYNVDRYVKFGLINGRLQFFNAQIQDNGSVANNLFFGAFALNSLRTDVNANQVDGNVAIGGSSLPNLTLGIGNLGLGGYAGWSQKSGNYNTFIGVSTASSGTGVNLTGSYNLLIGAFSGNNATVLNNSTIIGTISSSDLGTTNLTNEVAIGYGNGNIAFRKHQNGLTVVPKQTLALYNSDSTGKAIVTKEILENIINGIPAQLNLTAGPGISISGTYPNLTVTNTAPNVTQDLSSVLTAGNTTSSSIILSAGVYTSTFSPASTSILNPGTGKGVVINAVSSSIDFRHNATYRARISPQTLTQNSTHQLQDKDGVIAHLSDIDGAINVKMITIELTHAQVLALNTTPYDITSAMLGLQPGEKVKWLLDRCEWKVDSNGVIYDGSIRLHSSGSPICTFSIKGDGHYAGTEIILSDGYRISDTHYLSAWGTITGGTSGATVKIRLYYTTTTW